MSRRSPTKFVLVVGLQGLEQSRQVAGTEPRIHLGNAVLELRSIPLAETPCYIDLLHQALVLGLGPAENGVDALLLGIVDESTGIDHHDVVVAVLGLVIHSDAVRLQLGHHHLAVESVL